MEIHVETFCWLARVPSYSNIADKPSRGSLHELVAQGFMNQSDDVAAAVSLFFAFMEKKKGKTAECCVEFPMEKVWETAIMQLLWASFADKRLSHVIQYYLLSEVLSNIFKRTCMFWIQWRVGGPFTYVPGCDDPPTSPITIWNLDLLPHPQPRQLNAVLNSPWKKCERLPSCNCCERRLQISVHFLSNNSVPVVDGPDIGRDTLPHDVVPPTWLPDKYGQW